MSLPFDDGGNQPIEVPLGVWYIALPLVLSNLAYWFPVVQAYRYGKRAPEGGFFYYFVGAVIFVAMWVSIFYHMCQSTGWCFRETLYMWTISDHISAPAMMAILILFIVTPLATQSALRLNKKRLKRLMHSLRDYSGDDRVFAADNMAAWYEQQKKRRRLWRERTPERDQIVEAWTASVMYIYFFVVVLATLSHNFSIQSFIITLAFGLAAVVFKIIVLDEGDPSDLRERISLPDLIVGVVLLAIGIVFFVLDSYVMYWLMHSFWHVFGGIGAGFYLAGLSAHILDVPSPCALLWATGRRMRPTNKGT